MEIFIGLIPYSQFILSQRVEPITPIELNSFICETCKESYSTSRGLEIHTSKMHFNYPKTSVCTLCLKSFKNKYLLNTHKKQVHSKVQQVECFKCCKFFSSKFTLQKHFKNKHQAIISIN